MASFERDGAQIHYDDEGDGFPVLLIAPGGMRSANEVWNRTPWNPRAALADQFRLIGMDQRNAGRSTAPVAADDGWATYAADQLALLDHLGIDRCHLVGMCIGGPYIVGLLRAAPQRFTSAVVLQPVGIDDNRHVLEEMFDGWATDIAALHPEVDADGWRSFRSNMWDGEFVLTATLEQVTSIDTPTLLMQGDDVYHPTSTSRSLAERLPNVTFVERWKDDDVLDATDATISAFLAEHTP
ncbi:MAG: alpha/beta hydrolase [Acidimicrobiia bacterium]|nr:alpha/beta hydrolase [Acidimicrobiia bacterium]